MRAPRTLASAAVTAALLAAPHASADHELAECNFYALSAPAVTGPGTYDGVALGHVVAPGDTPTIRCEIWVNGALAAATPTSPPTPDAAVTAARVTYHATDSDHVQVCAVYTTRHGTNACSGPSPQVPHEAVWEAVNGVVIAVVDPVVCEVLKTLSPGVPPAYVNEQGDVYVAGELVWDCPPYDIWPPS